MYSLYILYIYIYTIYIHYVPSIVIFLTIQLLSEAMILAVMNAIFAIA